MLLLENHQLKLVADRKSLASEFRRFGDWEVIEFPLLTYRQRYSQRRHFNACSRRAVDNVTRSKEADCARSRWRRGKYAKMGGERVKAARKNDDGINSDGWQDFAASSAYFAKGGQ